MARQLLVTGWPRERVLDVGMLLNEHPEVALGVERFGELGHLSDQFLLEAKRLLQPISAETKIRGELLYGRLNERVAATPPTLVGDIDTEHVRALAALELRVGNNRVLVVIGESPRGRDERWRKTVEQAQEAERTRIGPRMFVLLWEPFAAGDERWLRALLGFLDLQPTERVIAAYERLCDRPVPGSVGAGADGGDAESIAWLHARARAELDAHAPEGRPLPAVLAEALLSTADLDARAAEREQLEVERAHGSTWPPEDAALVSRYRELVREADRRGRRMTTAILTAGTQFPSAALKVNLLSPSPDGGVIGRSELWDQLAVHLARFGTVRVFATQPRAAPLPGVELRLGRVDAATRHGEGDVLVYPGDLPHADQLLDARRAVMLLDGFEEPRGELVLSNLTSAREVIAASDWLAGLARDHGVPTVHVPLGLDRATFTHGPESAKRGLHVTGIAHTAGWMDCETLSEALVRVRETHPEVAVTLFGNVPADGVTRFVSNPPLRAIANILRSSAVHVVGSREEGFAYIGAGALACGAALVSTEIMGTAEYAIRGRTALLAPAGDPGALAGAVLELLGDVGERARLVKAGAEHVRRLLPPWTESARSIALALAADL